MSTAERTPDSARAQPGGASPAWAVVGGRELRDLWIGGKALHLILLYTVLLGLYAFLLASNAEVSLLPKKEMILEVVKAALAVALLMGMIIAADAVTHERERATLEGLLLTPARRTDIVLGKLLAAVSPIPVALLITVPYLAVLSKGEPIFASATLWLFVFGGLLIPALAAIGMLASVWSRTTKASMLVTLALYLLMLLPSEIIRPGKAMSAAEVRKSLLIQGISPIDAVTKFLGRVLVFDQPPLAQWHLLVTPALIGIGVLAVLFVVASPRLQLEPQTGRRLRGLWDRVARAVLPRGATATPSSPPSAPPRAAPEPTLPIPASTPRAGRPAGTRSPRPDRPPSALATAWQVMKREGRDLWVGGKALNLTIGYTVLLGGYSYWLAHDSSISVIPPKEMVFELMKLVMVVALFMGLIIGADSLSGERERTTLEALLLTPTSRRAMVVGKFLAAASTWPVAFAVTVPYVRLLAQGDEVFGQAVMWAAILGTILVPAFTAFGMIVSFWSNSNKSSMFVSLGLYLIFLLPTQLPGNAQGGFMGLLFQALNPMAGPRHFLAGVLVNNRTFAEYGWFLWSSVVFFVGSLVVLFWYAAPTLGLDAGRAARWPRAAAAALLAGLLAVVSPAVAQTPEQSPAATAATLSAADGAVHVSIDKADTVLRAGLPLFFNTDVTNTGGEPSPAIIVAMNIINLDRQGEVVDPEDWSPQRTQYVDPVAPGQSTTLSWRVNAILDGDYMVYMVAIPAPSGPDATSHPVASPGIHLTVTPYTKLNPGGVLPYAIGGPAVLGVIILLVYRHRRRQIDMGGAAAAE